MLSIQDRLFCSIKIDGTEIQYANLISILAAEGNGALIPTIKITLSDPTSAFSSEKALTEGNEIEVTFAQSPSDNRVSPRKYRVFGPVRGNQALNPTVEIVGILAAPEYISKCARESYKGTSEEVIKALAGKCSLKFSGPSSVDGRIPTDRQVWLNVCSNRAKFLMEVVRYSYIDQHSGMSATLTSYGELRFRDLIALINTPIDRIKYSFSHNTNPNPSDKNKRNYIVKEARDRSSAGLMSSWQNYGSTRAQNMLSGTHTILKELQVKMPGNFLPINKSVADQIERSRVEYAPLDCGNVHPHYETAKYQNIKLLALFSEKMSLLVDTVTDVQLYDVVVYRQEDADLTQPIKNTDVYIVVGKTLAVSGGAFYAERIELARMSLTMKGTAQLEQPGTFKSERSMIPDVNILGHNAGILTASNRGSVSSLSGLLATVSSGVGMLQNFKGLLNAPLAGCMSMLDSVRGNLLQGTLSRADMDMLSGSTMSLAGSMSTLTGTMDYVRNANIGLLTNLVGVQQPIMNQCMAQDNSLTSSLLGQYSILSPIKAALGATSALVSSLPYDLTSSYPGFEQLHSILNRSNSIANNMMYSTNNQWNSSIGVLRSVQQPSTFPEYSPIATTIQQGLSVNRLSDSVLLNSMHTGMLRDYNGQPNWIGNNSMNILGVNAKNLLDSSISVAKSYTNRFSENISA